MRFSPARFVLVILVSLFCVGVLSVGACARESGLPPALAPWAPWVLKGYEDRACPTPYSGGDERLCAWPTGLVLDVGPEGGRFEQTYQVWAETEAFLPGGPGVWPEEVQVDGGRVPVTSRDGVPQVRLEPGEHKIQGRFTWAEMPEMIQAPPRSALIQLTLAGRPVEFPVVDAEGRLWLQKRVEAAGEEDRLEVRLFRFIDDQIPMRVTNLVKLDVSGRVREVTLDGLLLPGSRPLSLDSPLPARLEEQGLLKVQVRPGRWDIRIGTRFEGPVNRIGPAPAPFGPETWAFKAANELRMVRVTGASSVDPGQTELPDGWKEFPAYIVAPGETLAFEEIRRGDPDPAPDRIHLERDWWLDFNGAGYTLRDRITGAMSRQWYLAMNPPAVLGRVSVSGEDQLITKHGPENKPGVELRLGRLNLAAESRFEAGIAQAPAVGWDHDFESVAARLHLPPGWRLLTASGVDVLPGTWFERWTLLDLFLVLIISLAVFKLTSWKWGLLALVTVGLCYHEPAAPRGVYIALLIPLGLLRVLPPGWLRRVVGLWRILAIAALLVISIPFAVHQVRVALYPQLENQEPWDSFQFPGGGLARYEMSVPMEEDESTGEAQYDEAPAAPAPKPSWSSKAKMRKDGKERIQQALDAEAKAQKPYALAQDPNAQIQTGPGLPTWKWRTLDMKWNGPVDRDQTIRLYLVSPTQNSILSVLRVVLLVLLVIVLIDFRRWWEGLGRAPKAASAAVSAAVFLLAVLVMDGGMAWAAQGSNRPPLPSQTLNQPAQVQMNQAPENQTEMNLPPNLDPGSGNEAAGSCFPTSSVLDDLRERLLEPPECLPHCAWYDRLDLTVREDGVTALLELHVQAPVAVPLPGGAKAWLPSRVMVNNLPAAGLSRDGEGRLWLAADKGIHRIVMTGPLPPQPSFQIPLDLRPSRVKVQADGWEVQGVHRDGRVDAAIGLTRMKKEGDTTPALGAAALPPFLAVERTLYLGLTWEVFTRVKRLTPTGAPVVAAIPLLSGESVTSAQVRTEKGKALVTLDARSEELSWSSTLEPSTQIQLTAPQGVPWVETWILDAGPIWHCEPQGIPVVHHQDEDGRWRPEWRPWPGETVTIAVTQPKHVPGQVLTIDTAKLDWTPGERFHKGELKLNLRSSQGGQHRLKLPEGAQLQVVRVNDRTLPIGQTGREVIVPLAPGSQRVELEWHQSADSAVVLKGPEVHLGGAAVNAEVTFHLSTKRWVLFAWGPRMGPAVLFWSFVAVVFLAALGLGRVPWTPLKFRHWLLLGLGLTQIHPLMAVIIVGFVLILGRRGQAAPSTHWFFYDVLQLGLILWAVVAAVGLYVAIHRGLLGIPDMQITGNLSQDHLLHWTMDRIDGLMPQPFAVNLPKYVFHGAMLVWALWLAVSLIRGLRWGWASFGFGGLWMKPKPRTKEQPSAAADEFIIEPPVADPSGSRPSDR